MEFVFVSICGLLIGTFGLALWGLSLRDSDPFTAEVVPIKEGRDGQVIRVTGRIRFAESVASVLGETVVLFDLELREPGVTKNSGYSRVLKESRTGSFVLEDHSGRARVDTASVSLVPARGTPFTAIDERVVALLDRRNRLGEDWRQTLRQRYISAQEGDRVSVVGRCRRDEEGAYRADGGVVLEASEGAPLLILIERPRSKRAKET